MAESLSKEEKIMIRGMSQSILDTFALMIGNLAVEEQILFNVTSNWLLWLSKKRKTTVDEEFKRYTDHLNNEILTALKISQKTQCDVEIDRKET